MNYYKFNKEVLPAVPPLHSLKNEIDKLENKYTKKPPLNN